MIAPAFDRMIRPRNAWEPLRIPRGCSADSRVNETHLAKVLAARNAMDKADGMDALLDAVGTKTWR
jgi:hypothetical protein